MTSIITRSPYYHLTVTMIEKLTTVVIHHIEVSVMVLRELAAVIDAKVLIRPVLISCTVYQKWYLCN